MLAYMCIQLSNNLYNKKHVTDKQINAHISQHKCSACSAQENSAPFQHKTQFKHHID